MTIFNVQNAPHGRTGLHISPALASSCTFLAVPMIRGQFAPYLATQLEGWCQQLVANREGANLKEDGFWQLKRLARTMAHMVETLSSIQQHSEPVALMLSRRQCPHPFVHLQPSLPPGGLNLFLHHAHNSWVPTQLVCISYQAKLLGGRLHGFQSGARSCPPPTAVRVTLPLLTHYCGAPCNPDRAPVPSIASCRLLRHQRTCSRPLTGTTTAIRQLS